LIGIAAHPQLEAEPLSELQTHDSIKAAAERHVQERLKGQDLASSPRVVFSEIDPRLRLRHCESPLTTYDPPHAKDFGRVSIGVRCNDNPGWSLYLSAMVAADISVVVSKKNLARNQVLGAEDVEIQVLASERLYGGFIQKIDEVHGKRMRRDLNSGQPLSAAMLVMPRAVSFGKLVTLISKSGGFEVRMQGKALGSGGVGEAVTVENLKSKRKVAGIILGQNLVEVR
jgi:flagella basal body P-ring formation protein FlgA